MISIYKFEEYFVVIDDGVDKFKKSDGLFA